MHIPGVIARHPSYYPILKKILTSDVVEKYFKHLLGENGSVKRLQFGNIFRISYLERILKMVTCSLQEVL